MKSQQDIGLIEDAAQGDQALVDAEKVRRGQVAQFGEQAVSRADVVRRKAEGVKASASRTAAAKERAAESLADRAATNLVAQKVQNVSDGINKVDWNRLTKSLEDASKAQDESLTGAVADRLVGSVMERAVSDVATPEPATRDLAAIAQSSRSEPAITPQAMQLLDAIAMPSLNETEVPPNQLPTSKQLFATIDRIVNNTTAATRESDVRRLEGILSNGKFQRMTLREHDRTQLNQGIP